MTIASCIGMVLRIMVLMADFTHILATRPDFTESDREWLHHLVADWQVIADLSFADLLLIVQDGDGNYRIVEQCRPSTVMTLRIDDAVGALVAPEMVGELDAAMQSKTVFRSTVLRRSANPQFATCTPPSVMTARRWGLSCVRPTWPRASRTAGTSPKASTRASSCTR